MSEPLSPRQRGPDTASIVELVFGVSARERRGRFVVAGMLALGAHAALLLALYGSEPTLEAWSAGLAARIHAELSREAELDVQSAPPSEPAHAPMPEPPAPTSPVLSRSHAQAHRDQSPSLPPAAAARVVGQELDPNAPVDLTANVFVTGGADAYAGGVTTSRGTSQQAVPRVVARSAAVPHRASGASPVRLEAQNWNCPWPPEAEAQEIDEQTAVLSVVVRPNGSVESASLVSDLGHGFGQAALACALQTRFTAARGPDGQPVRAESPPIRVRFTR